MLREENKSQSIDNIAISKIPPKNKHSRSFNSENDLYHHVLISKLKHIKSSESNSSNTSSNSSSPIRSIREDAYMRPYKPLSDNYFKKPPQIYTHIVLKNNADQDKKSLTKPSSQSSVELFNILNICLVILYFLFITVICKIILIEIFAQ
jgi:hypothetical protein